MIEPTKFRRPQRWAQKDQNGAISHFWSTFVFLVALDAWYALNVSE